MTLKTLILSAAIATALAVPAIASAFTGGTVVNVAASDVLKARKWPSSTSRVVDTYLNGDFVSFTGRCKNIVTNNSFYIDGPQSRAWKYNRMKKANVWCQVMTPDAELAWVRGKFVYPQ
jgi:hypothetical protein